jgi:hypothetical protein
MLRPLAVVAVATALAAPVAADAASSAWTWAGTMTDARIDESSSLAVSSAYPGIAYTANDENDPVYAVEIGTGRVVGSARLETQTTQTREAKVWVPKRKYAGNPAVTCQTKKQRHKRCKKATRQVPVVAPAVLSDPEAMATDSAGMVWLADTGDNDARRGGGVLYAFGDPGPGDHAVLATRYPIVYPGGASYNVETLLINPVTNAKYLVTKSMNPNVNGKVFALPKVLSPTTPNLAVDTGVTTIPAMVSDGDFSPRGTRVILRNGTPGSQEAYVLNASTWARLTSITTVPNSSSGKGESVSFDPKAPRFLTSREGDDAPLYWMTFDEATWR